MSAQLEWHEAINQILEARDPAREHHLWRVPAVSAADYRANDSLSLCGICPTKTRETAGSATPFPVGSTQVWLTNAIYQPYLDICWRKALLCLCEYNNKEGRDSSDFDDVGYNLSPEELARLYEAHWPRW